MADVEGTNLTFDQDKGLFYGPLPQQSEQDDKCTQQQMVSTSCLQLDKGGCHTLVYGTTQSWFHEWGGRGGWVVEGVSSCFVYHRTSMYFSPKNIFFFFRSQFIKL